MPQLGLFDRAPYQKHSRTSLAAARTINPKLGQLQLLALEFLREVGEHGATDEEMQESLGLNPSTQRPRRVELVKLGLAIDSGRTRKTHSNRNATVWQYNHKGGNNV